MIHVVGLDPSLTSTGIALEDRVLHLAAPGRRAKVADDPAMSLDLARFHGLADRIIVALVDYNPRETALFIEKPSLNSVHQAVNMAGVAWIVRDRLANEGYWYADVPPAVLKKYATGKGNAGKPEVVASAIRRLDYAGHDDNEADALWLREIGLCKLATPTVEMPKTSHDAFKKWKVPTYGVPSPA